MEPAILIDERQDIQKKTFTKWINSHLTNTQCSPVNDLFEDLRDGHRLLALLSVLTQTQLKPEKGRMRVHHINNLNKVLHVIQEHGVKLVNISSNDIVAGNPKLTLGLIWLIALEFNGQNLVKSHSSNGVEKSLLAWARQFTEPRGLSLNDFSSSWADGRAFLMVLDANLDDIDLSAALTKHPLARLKTAFDLAHKYFKIEKLLDPEDVHTHKPDNKSIQMYVMCLYHAIESRRAMQRRDSLGEAVVFDERGQEVEVPPNIDVTDLDEIPLDSAEEVLSDVSSPPLSASDSVKTPQSVNLTTGGDGRSKYNIDNSRNSITNLGYEDIKLSSLTTTMGGDYLRSSSRPLSTATNVSVEISTYQAALEAVLMLLLEDEQLLSRDLPEPHDFLSAKVQFHENEHFMLKLTEHQQYVGDALEEGSNLISEAQKSSSSGGCGGLSLEDQNEVRQQMVLLNERWETLRLRALDVQARILTRLAEFQTQQIDKLKSFLTSVEDRISRMTAIGPRLPEVQQQLQEVHNLKDDLTEQQNLFDSLNNMVVIVNDESGNFNDLEDKLSALAERWSHVLKWSELRVEKLQQYKCIYRWLDSREQDLKAMESRDVTDLGSITKRMNDLNYCAKDLLELERFLTDLRQMVAATLQDGDDKGERVLMQLESFEDRLDALKQIVEVQTVRIEAKGFKFGRDRASYDDSRVVRPDGWVDYQMIIKFGEGDDEEDDGGNDEEHQMSDTALASKKRKLRNTDNFYLLEGRIMECFNFLDDSEDRLNALLRYSLRNQSELLNTLDKELTERAIWENELQELYERCEKEEPERNLIMEATQLKQIQERYEKLKKRVVTQMADTATILQKEKFYNSLTGFKLVLADSRDWYKQHASMATKVELEQRLSHMESLSAEIATAKNSTATFGPEMLEWKQDFNIFYESWSDMKRAIIALIQERGGIDEVNRRLQILEEFMANVSKVQVRVSDLEDMKRQQKFLNELVEELDRLQSDYDLVQQRRPDSINTEFAESWAKVPEQLSELVIKQSTAIENLNHFTAEYNAIQMILRKLESRLQNEQNTSTPTEEMKNDDIGETDSTSHLNMELRKIEIDVISARNFSEIIIKDAEPKHKEHLLAQIKELNQYFSSVQDLHKTHSQKRIQVLAKSEEILERLEKTDIWLNDLESSTPKTKISEINNSNELFQIKCKFQTLKEMCEREAVNFRELNEIGGDVLLQVDELKGSNGNGESKVDSKYTTLAKKFTRLNARWTEVTAQVYAQTAVLEHISTQLGEFKKFMVSESGYLDRLDNKVRNTPKNADADEIIEELDDLENVLHAHSEEWLEKIQEIGNELIDHEFTATTIRKDIDTIGERWTQLQQRAKQRTEILEREISEAEQSEKCIVQFEAWLTRVNEILSEHLENDVTIEDLPDEFQRLEQEFIDNEKSFQEIDDLIAEHLQNGKTEAANRLQEQLNLLELRYKSCQLKLNKCTAPQPAYESRLNRAMAELRNVERSTLVLDVASAGSSTVHAQYDKCLQIYQTLYGIKEEIESTIKTGRKVCEDKYTRSPQQLNQRIDALKHLYNALGENVTQSKLFLETLLKLAHQLEVCFKEADQLIRRFESPQEIHDRNAEFLEFEKLLAKCEVIYEEYSNSCDPIYMTDTRQRIDDLKATYMKLTSADVIKRLAEMKTTLQNLDNISLETLKNMEHDLKEINMPSNPEIEKLQQQVIAIVVNALKERFDVASVLAKETVSSNTTNTKSERTPEATAKKEAEEEQETRVEEAVKTASGDDDTEIVIVSDTVRQRRSRTPSANDSNASSRTSGGETDTSTLTPSATPAPTPAKRHKDANADGDVAISADREDVDSGIEQQQVLPDLLPPQTFRLAESSTLFSHISNNTPVPLSEPSSAQAASDSKLPRHTSKKQNRFPPAKMVEIREANIPGDKMSVQNIEVEAQQQGEIVDTVSILESVEPFVPEYVETVQIVDVSEDSDSSMRVEGGEVRSTEPGGNEVTRSKSKRSLCDTPSPAPVPEEEVELRPCSPMGSSTPFLRVEKQRISFDEKRRRIESERDILRDSEEEDEEKEQQKQKQKQPTKAQPAAIVVDEPSSGRGRRWRPLQVEMGDDGANETTATRGSFYNDVETSGADMEPLVFSDDEEIPRFSLEMTPTFDSDSDASRIETPGTKKANSYQNKVLPSSPSLDDSNITLRSPHAEIQMNFRSSAPLEQRVQEFDKTAKYMIRKLEATKEKIEQCDEGEAMVEDLKLLIAPDAATLISQGDSLVLETHGKQSSISRLVMRTQILLREKFRAVQNAKSKVPEAQQRDGGGNTTPSPRSTLEKMTIKGINVEELVSKGLKRINDLIEKPLDRKSIDELEKRLTEINDRRDDLRLIVNAISKSEQVPKINANMMDDIEKTKNNLLSHGDTVELALAELQHKAINGGDGSQDYNDIPSGTGALAGSFDKSVLQISDWLTWEQNMIKIQSVPIDDIDAVRLAIEKQEKVLRELKMKKPQLNELVHTAEVLKGDVKRQQLQEKVTRLREHWDETSQCVLQRAAQLKNMLSDSQRYEAKRLELEKWLARMEGRAERMGTVAATADVLDAQQKEQKSFHAELHQMKQQFELFSALTQKLIAVYPADDTTRIKKMTEAINQRYANLNNGVITRGKQLHAAVNNLQSFDRTIDQFLAFLSEAESLCENAEAEIDRNPLMYKVSLVISYEFALN